MDASTLRAWWAHKQGLHGRLRGQSPSAALEQTGWARSVADVEIHELPSARDRSYVVPESDFALALRCGREAANVPIKMAVKLGITEKEIDTLGTAILKALKTGAQDPTTIREAIGGASRSLGPEGIRKGMTTTLPLGLGLLQATGQIRRVPVNGRLDQQRYKYTLWNLPPVKLTDSEIYTQLARKFFSWIGPAQLSEFQWFSGLCVKAAQTAIAPWNLAKLDNGYLLNNDNPNALHAITGRGRLIGLWEYAPSVAKIVYLTFDKPPKEVPAAIKDTETYITDQLGDARFFQP